jgi:hypothetical protein
MDNGKVVPVGWLYTDGSDKLSVGREIFTREKNNDQP